MPAVSPPLLSTLLPCRQPPAHLARHVEQLVHELCRLPPDCILHGTHQARHVAQTSRHTCGCVGTRAATTMAPSNSSTADVQRQPLKVRKGCVVLSQQCHGIAGQYCNEKASGHAHVWLGAGQACDRRNVDQGCDLLLLFMLHCSACWLQGCKGTCNIIRVAAANSKKNMKWYRCHNSGIYACGLQHS